MAGGWCLGDLGRSECVYVCVCVLSRSLLQSVNLHETFIFVLFKVCVGRLNTMKTNENGRVNKRDACRTGRSEEAEGEKELEKSRSNYDREGQL